MRKRRSSLIGMMCAILCFCALWVRPVRADVIWEPVDSFYEKHSSECTYVNRQFTAKGPEGKVILYKSPVLPEQVTVWENGYQAYISFTYKDSYGIVWGIFEGENGMTGWMPMAYMEAVYDSISFQEEFEDEIQDHIGELDESCMGEEVFFWIYPGSRDNNSIIIRNNIPQYRWVYEDPDGHRFGRVAYYFGLRDVWVCIDAPGADYEQLYSDGISRERLPVDSREKSENEGISGDGEDGWGTQRIVPKADRGVVWTAVVLVVLVTAGTAVLLMFLRKKDNR